MSARKTQSPSGEVRLIAGRWRGRKLRFFDSQGLRPTGARIRETLFNWLMYDVEGATCLDLFAGSGVLGFEALSRGAAAVTAIESESRTARQLAASAELLGASGYRVHCVEALQWLQSTPATPFDIVFLDPPFADNLLVPVCGLLEAHGWLAPTALVYIETGRDALELEGLPAGWERHREASAGAVSFNLYRA